MVLIRVIPRFLAWLVKRKYKIDLQVGHISLPYFIVRDVNISTNGFTIVSLILQLLHKTILKNCAYNKLKLQEIEECSVRSSLFSSEVAKLLSVMLRGVRVNVDVPAVLVKHKNRSNKVLDFRNTKIPSFIITVVQVSFQQFLMRNI